MQPGQATFVLSRHEKRTCTNWHRLTFFDTWLPTKNWGDTRQDCVSPWKMARVYSHIFFASHRLDKSILPASGNCHQTICFWGSFTHYSTSFIMSSDISNLLWILPTKHKNQRSRNISTYTHLEDMVFSFSASTPYLLPHKMETHSTRAKTSCRTAKKPTTNRQPAKSACKTRANEC